MDELRTRWFNKVLDGYLTTGTMDGEDYEALTPAQREVVQCIKRALKRINKR